MKTSALLKGCVPLGASRVDRNDHGLRAEFGANLANQLRPSQRRRVDADLVRASIEHRRGFFRGADASPNRERDKEPLSRAPDRVEQRASSLRGWP